MGKRNVDFWTIRLVSVYLVCCLLLSPIFTPQAYAQTTPPVVNFNCNAVGFKVQIAPINPTQIPAFSQSPVNCMAWQTFIALNWKANPQNPGQPDLTATAEQFGDPADSTDPVVWESYKDVSDVFRPNPVKSWKSPQLLPESFRQFKNIADLTPTSNFGFKPLTATSKFADGPDFILDETTQAFTNSWLTAQNQSLTFYEIRLNQDEYEYITQNNLTSPQAQQNCATGSAGLNLPSGSADSDCANNSANYGSDGAIEIKAAWVELKDSSLYPKYKISQAIIKGPNDAEPRQATMGLVGLHIIHKVPNGKQFVWATFEHVDNAPTPNDINNGNLKPSYTYYNHACDPQTDRYQCKFNYQPQPCNSGQQSGCDPYTAPVQVVRLNPIPSPSASLNRAVWSTITQVNPDSVFQNYQLIDTIWPNASSPVPPGATTPLNDGNPQSGTPNNYVANTTMETYLQQAVIPPTNKGGCLGCHVLAPIASPTKLGTKARVLLSLPKETLRQTQSNAPLASDYSFVFSQAQAIAKHIQPKLQEVGSSN
ncbi:hypothetical protein FACHB389_28670 [Nostoc calcicola FACHB-389]|nr:hypothetical protein [Nostoc calcicola FACHB-3891]OKH27526.1 hypothetical protein FACHB389_28670 [Nostoc calcicola FACHB-389]